MSSVLVQISDPHLGRPGRHDATGDRLRATLDAVRELPQRPDAVLLSGDVTESSSSEQYAQAASLLGDLDVPVYVLAGNHDDPPEVRAWFGPLGAGPAGFVARVGRFRLVGVDTTIPGEDGGALGADGLAWLAATLDADRAATTLVAMHHLPIRTGVPPLDAIALAPGDARALGELLRRHGQVRRVLCGHVHRAMFGSLGGCCVVSAPSTGFASRLDLRAPGFVPVDETPAFLLHVLTDDGEVTTHVQPIR